MRTKTVQVSKEVAAELHRLTGIMLQARYATTEACVMCDKLPHHEHPKRTGCDKCHVGKLLKMLKEA